MLIVSSSDILPHVLRMPITRGGTYSFVFHSKREPQTAFLVDEFADKCGPTTECVF